MLTLGLDVETTKAPYMHPWQKQASLVSIGLANEAGWRQTWWFNHNEDRLFSIIHSATGEVKAIRYTSQREMINDIQVHVSFAHRLVGHNIKFDLNWLNRIGIEYQHCRLWCTQVTEYLLRGQRLGQLKLADISTEYGISEKIDLIKTFWDAGYETQDIPLHVLRPYLEQDCINALAVYQRQVPRIKAENMEPLAAVMNESTRVLSEIECNGMRVDRKTAESHYQDLTQRLVEIDAELMLIFDCDINLNSNQELSAALYGGTITRQREEWFYYHYKSKPETKYDYKMVDYPVKLSGLGFETTSDMETKIDGVYSVDKNTIKFLKATNKKQRNAKRLLIERSKIAKAMETLRGKDDTKGILNKIQIDGCCHSQYNQTVAKTGRLSSKDPNGQNIPRDGTSPIKQSFIARFDYILEVDLSQIEWRVAAFLSQDPVMLREIREGVDPHTENAINILGADPKGNPKKFKELRTVAKVITFRLLYGGSAMGFYFDQSMPNWSKKRWQQVVDAFYEKYQGLADWQAANLRKVWATKGILINPTGRKFIFHKHEGGYKRPQVCNFPVQSLATADIMVLAMILIYRRFKNAGFESEIIGQVHDSLLFDCKKEEIKKLARMCIDIFEHMPEYIERTFGFKFNVPLTGDAEYGKCWGDMQELKLAA